jgi:hypothetical protein
MDTARQHFRQVLAALAEKTQSKMPALNGRIAKSVKLVLAGDVEVHDDKSALVNSASDPTKSYLISQGVCQCKDYLHAPEHLCCHRLAAGFARKIAELVPAEAPKQSHHNDTFVSSPLPEAPASANVRLVLQGHEVQITLRDYTEEALLVRLEALLRNTSLRPIPKPAPKGQQWRKR